MKTKTQYWFKPARFWKWFACYYPVSISGWIATIVLTFALIKSFILVDAFSHSSSDTLISFAPWAIGIFLFFDFLCFRFGEYPSWWRRK